MRSLEESSLNCKKLCAVHMTTHHLLLHILA